jgi:hypothetical protein
MPKLPKKLKKVLSPSEKKNISRKVPKELDSYIKKNYPDLYRLKQQGKISNVELTRLYANKLSIGVSEYVNILKKQPNKKIITFLNEIPLTNKRQKIMLKERIIKKYGKEGRLKDLLIKDYNLLLEFIIIPENALNKTKVLTEKQIKEHVKKNKNTVFVLPTKNKKIYEKLIEGNIIKRKFVEEHGNQPLSKVKINNKYFKIIKKEKPDMPLSKLYTFLLEYKHGKKH